MCFTYVFRKSRSTCLTNSEKITEPADIFAAALDLDGPAYIHIRGSSCNEVSTGGVHVYYASHPVCICFPTNLDIPAFSFLLQPPEKDDRCTFFSRGTGRGVFPTVRRITEIFASTIKSPQPQQYVDCATDLAFAYFIRFLLVSRARCVSAFLRQNCCAGHKTSGKGFSDLSADAGDLALQGDYVGAAANMILNIATAGVALLARLKAEKIFLQVQVPT